MSRRVKIHGFVKLDYGQGGQSQQDPRCLPQSNGVVYELNYFDVQLLKDDLCGVGSYGRVCKAMVDQLTCAAKIIHPTFFAEVDPSSTKTMLQFQKECEFLSVIRHPCIIQYLGITQDIETGLPVLLMELMEENLTQFLGRICSLSEEVPYHTVVNICHDVLMALAFLHSNGIVHRDLSSNNILMVAETKAKVTDFGMAKLIDGNRSRQREMLTQCPGTLVYMPPEALRTPPTYNAKLDVFSLGVVSLQIITCYFPSPGDAKRTVEDLRHGTIEVPIPEKERRKSDIASVQTDHPLLGTVLDCLADYEGNRPSSTDLCHRMLYYKSCAEYRDSIAQADKKRKQRRGLEEEIARKDREIASLKLKLSERTGMSGSVAADVETEFETITVATAEIQISDISLEAPPTSQWFHGPISRASACQQLEAVGSPGAYLIRESSSERRSLVLSFLDSSQRVHHFRIIKSIQGQYNIGGNIWFPSLAKLVGFHTKYSSVMENVSERLDIPVAPADTVSLPPYVL